MGTEISYKQILLCPLGSHHPGAVHSTEVFNVCAVPRNAPV